MTRSKLGNEEMQPLGAASHIDSPVNRKFCIKTSHYELKLITLPVTIANSEEEKKLSSRFVFIRFSASRN